MTLNRLTRSLAKIVSRPSGGREGSVKAVIFAIASLSKAPLTAIPFNASLPLYHSTCYADNYVICYHLTLKPTSSHDSLEIWYQPLQRSISACTLLPRAFDPKENPLFSYFSPGDEIFSTERKVRVTHFFIFVIDQGWKIEAFSYLFVFFRNV